jgi:hypothetical protein
MTTPILPADIINRSLDYIGRSDLIIGDIEEGTEAAEPALRAYGPARKQLLRAAHWNFARRQAQLTLLADATGNTAGVGTTVQAPWYYCYAFPTDCLKARFLPWNGNSSQPTTPLTTGPNNILNPISFIPAPFIVALESNYPIIPVTTATTYSTWASVPAWWDATGTGPYNRTVINTNVPPYVNGDTTTYPSLVYTCDVIYPSQWDALFEQAMVSLLAARLALSLAKDPKFGLELQTRSIASAKAAIADARATNGNEAGFPQTQDHLPDYVRIRMTTAYSGYNGGTALQNVCAYDGLSLPDGSVY